MGEPHPYRADGELAAALRLHGDVDQEFLDTVRAWNAEHPGTEILWSRGVFSADDRPVGFADGHEQAPAGLSRRRERRYLIPRRGAAGAPWRDLLAWAGTRPSLDKVLRRFGVPTHADGPTRDDLSHAVAPTQWADCGEDGVVVFNHYDLVARRLIDGPAEPQSLTRHLTPMPLSEFYAIKERLDAARAAEKEAGRA